MNTENKDAVVFYDKGLRFKCARCGRCCTGAPGTVRVTDSEIDAIAEFLGMERAEFVKQYLRRAPGGYSIRDDRSRNWACLLYGDDGCEIYAVRPAQCRTWPFWHENLRSEASWKDAGKECPGIGQGRLCSADDIAKMLCP